MAEVAPSGGGGVNRTFLLIVGGLAGLLILGLVALSVFFLLPGLMGGGSKTPVAQAVATPTKILIVPTATVGTRATDTPTTAASPTLVVAALSTATATTSSGGGFVTATPTKSGGGTSTGTGTGGGSGSTAAQTPAAGETPTKGGETSSGDGSLPSSGLGDDLLLLAAGLVLVIIIFAVRFARASH